MKKEKQKNSRYGLRKGSVLSDIYHRHKSNHSQSKASSIGCEQDFLSSRLTHFNNHHTQIRSEFKNPQTISVCTPTVTNQKQAHIFTSNLIEKYQKRSNLTARPSTNENDSNFEVSPSKKYCAGLMDNLKIILDRRKSNHKTSGVNFRGSQTTRDRN